MAERGLYLDRRAEDREARIKYGLEVSPEESFMAGLGIMSQYLNYRTIADDLYRRYAQADDAAKLLVIGEFQDVYEQFNLFRYGPELVAKLSGRSPYANVGARISAKGPFAAYGYKVEMGDEFVIRQWKDGVEKFRTDFTAVLSNPGMDVEKYQHVINVIGVDPERKHIDRMAIAAFVCEKLSNWDFVKTDIRALFKMIFGGINSLGNFGRQADFCADAALVAQLLSDEFGYRAQVQNVHPDGSPFDKGRHQCLVYEDGARIDPYFFAHLSGYLADSANYRKEFSSLSFFGRN